MTLQLVSVLTWVTLKSFTKSFFLCDGQGTVRNTVLGQVLLSSFSINP